ncbi:MAG: hypothetical protein ACT4P2_03105 [Pseudomonadota bacterium]
MEAISSLSQLNSILSGLRSNQKALAEVQRQLATGVKSADLAGYGADATRLIDVRSAKSRREAYLKAMDDVQPRLKAYDLAFTDLLKVARELRGYILNAQLSGQPDYADLAVKVKALAISTGSDLNLRFGDRYLFGGAITATPPVVDLTTLPTLAFPPESVGGAPTKVVVGNRALADYTLPDYSPGAPSPSEPAWRQPKFSADDNFPVTYGFTATEPALQNLVLALRYAGSAAAGSVAAQQSDLLNKAKGYIDAALVGLRDLEGQTSATAAVVARARDNHVNTLALSKDVIGDIESVDLAEAATKSVHLQTQLSASLHVTGAIASLSLVNFLR